MKNHLQPAYQPDAKPAPPRSHPIRSMVGAAGLTLALMNISPAVDTADAAHVDTDKPTADYNLPKPHSLRGYGIPLSPETRKKGKEATVEIRYRYNYGPGYDVSDQPWIKSCTAVKTIVDGKIRASTSSHCFEQITEDRLGIMTPREGQPSAANYINTLGGNIDYAVFDPQVDPAERKFKPLAKIDGISIATGQDWALLSVAPLETKPEGVPRTFEQIPALPLPSTQEKALSRPKPGQRVSLYGVFSANGERQSTSLGRYLGRITHTNKDGSIRYMDVVGLKPKTIAEDTCLPGSSGSSFTATGKGGRTYMSGPMAGYTNELWAPAFANNQQGDDRPDDVSNEIEHAKQRRLSYSGQLNVDISSFTTICTFTANLPGQVQRLNKGFEVIVPKPVRDDSSAVGFESGKGGEAEQSMK